MDKVKIDRKTFVTALKMAASVVEKKNNMPILTYVLLDANGEVTTLMATDIETVWRTSIPSSGGSLKVCIPCRPLQKAVSALSKDIDIVEIALKKDTSTITVIINDCLELFGMSPEEFPIWPEMKGDKVEAVIPGFAHKVQRALLAAGDSDTRYALNGVLIDLDNSRIVGTDGHRLHIAKGFTTDGKGKYIVPRRAAVIAAKHDAEKIMFTKERAVIELPNGKISVRLIDGTFPKIDQVLPYPESILTTIGITSSTFQKALEDAMAIRGFGKITLESDSLTIETNNPDIGTYRKQLKCSMIGNAITVGFNTAYLIDAIKAVKGDEDKIVLSLSDVLSPCLISSETNTQAVVMPMRI